MTSTHAPIRRPHDSSRAPAWLRRGRTGPWRQRLLATGVTLAVAGLLVGVNPTAAGGDYLLISRDRLLSLPKSGNAWEYMIGVARSGWAAPELDDQDNKTNVEALAAALVYARTGDGDMRSKARNAIERMIPTYNLSEDSGLGPARQVAGWVLTADLIGLDGALDGEFRELLRRALTRPIGSHSRWGGSLVACHEDSDNNWGAWCGASRVAAALYLGDGGELAQAERVYRGFLGDRDAWSRFRGQGGSNDALNSAIRTWSCDASASSYVPTNPDCGDRAGAFPADASRSGEYRQFDAQYQSETTAAITLTTELLYQNGYGGAWSRNAISRIAAFDYKHGAWNLGTVQYHWPWLVNKRLGTSYPTVAARYGRTFGYTDWLYGSGGGGGDPDPVPTPKPDPTPTPRPDPTTAPAPDPTADPAPDPTPAPKRGKGHTRPKPHAGSALVGATSDGAAPGGPSGDGSTGGRDGKGKATKLERPAPTSDAVIDNPQPLLIGSLIAAFVVAALLVQVRRREDSA